MVGCADHSPGRWSRRAVRQSGIRTLAIGGGVAANQGLRDAVSQLAREENLQLFLPERRFTTDNAAMIAIAGYFKFRAGLFVGQDVVPSPRLHV